jgi:hypothetical protein
MPNFAFITGIARSGTNLIGRMLGQHRDFAVAMDPFMPVLKWFRSSVASARVGARGDSDTTPSAPIGDYYFSRPQLDLMRSIQAANLEQSIDVAQWPVLQEDIAQRAIHECADLVSHLAVMKAPTYAEVWQRGLDLIAR